VDLSGVVCATNGGTEMIHHKRRCFLCGLKKGLKMQCVQNDCFCKINGQKDKLVVHVTCARQAGLEVRVDDERMNDKGGPLPYGVSFHLYCFLFILLIRFTYNVFSQFVVIVIAAMSLIFEPS
jgi:hypothetical protein